MATIWKSKSAKYKRHLVDYNNACKKLKIDLCLPDYNELKQYEDLESTMEYIIMQIIGEIAFHKHIKEIQLNQMPFDDNGLLNLIELLDFIDYLYKINSRKKTRLI